MKHIYFMIIAIALSACCERADANPEYIAATRKAEAEYGIPFGLLGGICEQESDWNPHAVGAAGEIGLCQLKLSTAKDYCEKCEQKAPVLYQGMKGERVLMIKTRLFQNKYYKGPMDTTFDLQLHIAVSAFQRDNNLKDDGIVGGRTWEKIFGYKMTGNNLLDQLYDPLTNIQYAARHLSALMKKLNTRSYEYLAIAYNSGEVGHSTKYITRVRRNVAKQTTGTLGAPRFN